MSQVSLLAADHSLPPYASEARRIRTVSLPGGTVTVKEDGFSIGPLTYFRAAVEDLGLAQKPFRYELDLEDTPQDLGALRTYLSAHCAPGERVELWNLWVGGEALRAHRFSGRLEDFDLDTLRQLQERFQTCITIEI